MMPVVVTVNGTGVSRPIVPDINQNPFNIGIGITSNNVLGTANPVAVWQVEHCFDWAIVMSPTWNGSTGVTWIPNTGLNSLATGTIGSTAANGNYAFPVAAIRLNIGSTVATSSVTMNFIQATNAP